MKNTRTFLSAQLDKTFVKYKIRLCIKAVKSCRHFDFFLLNTRIECTDNFFIKFPLAKKHEPFDYRTIYRAPLDPHSNITCVRFSLPKFIPAINVCE